MAFYTTQVFPAPLKEYNELIDGVSDISDKSGLFGDNYSRILISFLFGSFLFKIFLFSEFFSGRLLCGVFIELLL